MAALPDASAFLAEWDRGNRDALDERLPLVSVARRRMAAREPRHERTGRTLQPTARGHEAYVRLVDQRQVDWRSRSYSASVTARLVRGIGRAIEEAAHVPGLSAPAARREWRTAGACLTCEFGRS